MGNVLVRKISLLIASIAIQQFSRGVGDMDFEVRSQVSLPPVFNEIKILAFQQTAFHRGPIQNREYDMSIARQ